MNTFYVRLIVVAFIATVVSGSDEKSIEKYPTKYDHLDVDKILKNDRILTSYLKCIMDEGPCTAEGRELKKILPDALATDCVKCSEKQKTTSHKVITFLSSKRVEDWQRLLEKFDPTEEFQKRYQYLSITE